MQTIRRHYSGGTPHRDYPVVCATCAVPWKRSELRRDGDGRLQCPICFGPSVADLNRGNARRVRAQEPLRQDIPPAVFDALEPPHPDWEPGDLPPITVEEDAPHPITLIFANLIEYWDSALSGCISLIGGAVEAWIGGYAGIALQSAAPTQRATYNSSDALFNGDPTIGLVGAKLRATGLSLGLNIGDELYLAFLGRRIVANNGTHFQVADASNNSPAFIAGRTVPVPFHAVLNRVGASDIDINLASSTPTAPHLFQAWFDGSFARGAIDGTEGTPQASTGIIAPVSQISMGAATGEAPSGQMAFRQAVLVGATTPSEIAAYREYAAGLHV